MKRIMFISVCLSGPILTFSLIMDIFPAETALLLHRNVNFEVPSINKQIKKHQSNSEEYLRKSNDMIKQANKLKAEFQAMAEKLGIKVESYSR